MKLLHNITAKKPVVREKYDKAEVVQCYLMIGLQIIGLLLVTLYPICWAIRLAWYYYDGVLSSTRFVGFENFITIFTKDTVYWRTWLTTIKFTLMKLPIELPFAMFIALLLNAKIKAKGFFRSVFFLPTLIGSAIIGVIFFSLFDYFGIMNAILKSLGIISSSIDWFADPSKAMLVLVLGSVWSTFGSNVLYFLAALKNIPSEVYESADLDGASKFVVFFKITLPMIAPILQMILLLSINGTLHVGDFVLVMTAGGPSGSTHTVMSYIINSFVPGFAVEQGVNIGYGCALSLVTSVFMTIIEIAYMKISTRLANMY